MRKTAVLVSAVPLPPLVACQPLSRRLDFVMREEAFRALAALPDFVPLADSGVTKMKLFRFPKEPIFRLSCLKRYFWIDF